MMSIHETDIGGDGTETALGIENRRRASAGDMKLGDLEALRGVVKFPVRIKCATLELEHTRPSARRSRSRLRVDASQRFSG